MNASYRDQSDVRQMIVDVSINLAIPNAISLLKKLLINANDSVAKDLSHAIQCLENGKPVTWD